MEKNNSLILGTVFLFFFFGNRIAASTQNFVRKQNTMTMQQAKIVFLITEDSLNYQAHKTIPVFAKLLQEKFGYHVTTLLGSGKNNSYRYSNIDVISKADLLIVFARRIALPHDQMAVIKTYLDEGKPIIGIRTANHAFTVLDKIENGFEDWPEFVSKILGCQNRGYGPVLPGTDVSINVKAKDHPILKDIYPFQWHSEGNIYLVSPLLDEEATVLLIGKVNKSVEPVAWIRNSAESKVFYTSLGYPSDFQNPQFITLLTNAINWALDKH